ncbi:MAG: hypothetical protein EOP05_20760, partial [Proteobacteria bacterium]
RTEQENYILQKKLESLEYEFSGLSFSGVHPAGLAASADRLTGTVIINLMEWNAKEAIVVNDLRKAGYSGPVLVTAKADLSSALAELRAMKDVTFLEKPFDTKDLVGIVRKMLHARAVAQRIHRRFDTAQDAEIESDAGKKMASRVRNLSRGGAYLEFMVPAPVKIGDRVKVTLELKDVNRTYTLPAKVVWTSRGSGRGAGVGVEFTGPGDVKSAILGY